MLSFGQRDSFTLIELLVVLAIVAILSTVVIMTLNPAELLRQARDSNRLSDLATLNTALAVFSADITGGFMGTSTIVYVSLPDTTSTCSNLSLPALPAGYTYNCVTSQNLRNSNGTGWVPVNFSQISFGAPLASLPVDPINTTSSGNYYTYVTGGSFMITAMPESAKQRAALFSNPNVSNYPGVMAMGNNLSISPLYSNTGLVGYWNFDDGGGTTAKDSSGSGGNGTLVNGPLWVSGKTGGALSFDGVNDYVDVGTSTSALQVPMTLVVWYLPNNNSGNQTIIGQYLNVATGQLVKMIRNQSGSAIYFAENSSGGYQSINSTKVSTAGGWNFMAVSISGSLSSPAITFNFNGSSITGSIGAIYGSPDTSIPLRIGGNSRLIEYFSGLIDDVRVYNRALSAAEMMAIYNATK